MNIKKIKYYIKIHNSPRSRILPKHYNLELIDFVFNISLFKSIGLLPYKLINKRKNVLPIKSKIMIEYGGNIFLNFWIIFFNLKNRNNIVLDCHNSALENDDDDKVKIESDVHVNGNGESVVNAQPSP